MVEKRIDETMKTKCEVRVNSNDKRRGQLMESDHLLNIHSIMNAQMNASVKNGVPRTTMPLSTTASVVSDTAW